MPSSRRKTRLKDMKARKAMAARLEEEGDNNGAVVKEKIKKVNAELAGLLSGAPHCVKNQLSSEHGAALTAKDYEETAYFSAYNSLTDELIGVREMGFSIVEPHGRYDMTPFYIACARGSIDVVEWMASEPNLFEVLNAPNRSGATPFFAAVANGHNEVAKFLASKRKGEHFSVDIEKPNENGISPWEMAEANEDSKVLDVLSYARNLREEYEASLLARKSLIESASPAKSRQNGDEDELDIEGEVNDD